MRPAGRPAPDDRGPWPRIGLWAAAALALILGLLLLDAGSSPEVQWEVGLLALAVLAALAMRRVVRGTARPEPLQGPAAPGPTYPGPIGALSRTVHRASRGLPFSQVIVASRARAAFLERVRLTRGLLPEDVRAADAETLRGLIRDDVLWEFLHFDRGDLGEQDDWVRRARRRRGFDLEFRDVLDRMEAWR